MAFFYDVVLVVLEPKVMKPCFIYYFMEKVMLLKTDISSIDIYTLLKPIFLDEQKVILLNLKFYFHHNFLTA